MTDANKTTKASVLVGCRFPAGLVLRLYRMVDQKETLPGGRVQTIKQASPVQGPGGEVRLKGSADRQASVAVDLRGRYGITEVASDFWDEWVKQQGAESDLLNNHIVFAAATATDLKAMNKDIGREPTGLEPIDPKNPGEKLGGRDKKKIETASTVEE